MPDNLTARIKEELAKRGTVATEAQIFNILQQRQESQPSPFARRGGPLADTTQLEEQQFKGSVLNALGAGLWSALDVAAFGVPGAFVEEEKFLDFEDPLAKWTGALGGLAGFVAGAPLKVGAKAVSLAAKPFFKGVGKKSVESVVSGMKVAGREAGLDRKVVKEVTKGYKNLVRNAQINKDFARNFGTKVDDYLTAYLRRAEREGILNAQQISAIRTRVFSDNVYKRPLQDFIGLIAERGILANRPRAMRVLGHAMNDALMFGMIDTVFEGVSTIEDHEFDWTAPLWGVATGVAFSQLSWLKPKGKGSKWIRDFRDGVKLSFAKKPYAGKTRDQLKGSAEFYAKAMEESGRSVTQKIAYKGKERRITLDADTLWDDLAEKFGKDDAEGALKHFLENERRKFGREIMSGATLENFQDLSTNWMRMMVGGIVFNTHTFASMFMGDIDADVNDILPHFLIGAFLQRGRNPHRFDLDGKKMNRIRENLFSLGFHPEQLNSVPSFAYSPNRFGKGVLDSKFKPVLDALREEGIITDSNEVYELEPPKGEATIDVKENPEFRRLYDDLKGVDKYLKPLHGITVGQAKRIMDIVKKIDPKIKTVRDMESALEEANQSATSGFEREFSDIIQEVKKSDEGNELEIVFDTNRDVSGNRVPLAVQVSEEFYDMAERGELSFLRDRTTGEVLKGDKAIEDIERVREGFNSILSTVRGLGLSDTVPVEKTTPTVRTANLLETMYARVTEAESRIDNAFPDKSSTRTPFTFRKYFNDYVNILGKNRYSTLVKGIANIFKQGYPERSKLIAHLVDVKMLVGEADIGLGLQLRDDTRRVRVVDEKDEAEAARLKRILNRILTIQTAANVGVKGGFTIADPIPEGKIVEVKAESIRFLEKWLGDKGFVQKESMFPYGFQHNIVDHLLLEKIKNTEITFSEVDALFKLSEIEVAGFGAAIEGEAAGFKVLLLDENFIPPGQGAKSKIREYNKNIKDIIKRSNGLVAKKGKPAKVLSIDMLNSISTVMNEVYHGNESFLARQHLTEFLNQLSNIEYGNFRDASGVHLGNPGGPQQVMSWLVAAKVLVPTGNRKAPYDTNMKMFNKELAVKLTKRIENYGLPREYIKQIYENHKQVATEIASTDVVERIFSKNITLDEFFNRYRFEEAPDISVSNSDAKRDFFDSLVFANKEDRMLHVDSINQLLDVIQVKASDNKYVKLSEIIDEGERHRRTLTVTRELIGLLGSQSNQIRRRVFQFDEGKVIERDEVSQHGNLDRLFDSLEMKIMLADTQSAMYEFSEDGRRVNYKFRDIFTADADIRFDEFRELKSEYDLFESLLSINRTPEGEFIFGDAGEAGLTPVIISSHMAPMILRRSDFTKLNEPFTRLANRIIENDKVQNVGVKDRMREVMEAMENGTALDLHYKYALRFLIYKDMLTGRDGNRKFVDFLNGNDVAKLVERIKLYNTPNFVRFDPDFLIDIADQYERLRDTDTSRVIRRIVRNDGFGVAMWNDSGYATVKQEVDRILRERGITDWDWESAIGTAHLDVSAFDSIAFVSRNQMRYAHSILGHNPNSTNPLKPIISSTGANTPLLMGKTLFMYDKTLDPFFERNPDVDIMITKTGAKVYNEGATADQLDPTLINKPYNRLNEARVIGPQKIRKISLRSLGLLPQKDAPFVSAKQAQADLNFMTNAEAANYYNANYLDIVRRNVKNMSRIFKSTIRVREFMLNTLGAESLASDEGGLTHLSNMAYWSSLTADANPASYSHNGRLVKNKAYGFFINSITNELRSFVDGKHRFGGQAALIQSIGNRLLPTIVDADGTMRLRGEVMLGAHEFDTSLTNLVKRNGLELRVTEGPNVYTIEEVLDDAYRRPGDEPGVQGKKAWDEILNIDPTIGSMWEHLEILNEGLGRNFQLGVIIRRNPRTRPNDMAMLGLKGFLDKDYGNSLQVNSLDITNVFEGDYDFDKADYFFAHRPAMFDHVERTSKFFVQGIDPSQYTVSNKLDMGQGLDDFDMELRRLHANTALYTSGIGRVQKIPRALGFVEKVGYKPLFDVVAGEEVSQDPVLKAHGVSAPILFSGPGYRIISDFDNADFYTRAALEAQYIIDASSGVHPEIFRDIREWRDEFLFPAVDQNSVTPREVRRGKFGFVQDMVNKKAVSRRVRIFRKIREDGTEVELNSFEKAAIKELITSYNSFLNVAAKSMWENTGRQKPTGYDDMMDAAEKFFVFNKDLSKGLYYALRYRTDDAGTPFYLNKQFRDAFRPQGYTSKGKVAGPADDISWYKPTRDMFEDDPTGIGTSVKQRANQVYKGGRGNVIERILWNVWDADPYRRIRPAGVTGDVRGIMDDWYMQLVEGKVGNVDDVTNSMKAGIDELTFKVKTAAMGINRRVNLVMQMQKKIAQVKKNERMAYKTKQSLIEPTEELITTLVKELGDMVPSKFRKTMKGWDLEKIQYVAVDANEDVIEGAIQYGTINNIAKIMGVSGDRIYLPKEGERRLKSLLNLRKMFYGNRITRLKDILNFGDRTLLDSDTISLLKQWPSLTSAYEIENKLLVEALNADWGGIQFIFRFMDPTNGRGPDKNRVGVFEGRPVPVYYGASARYSRGIHFLTSIANTGVYSKSREMTSLPNAPKDVERLLKILQVLEAQHRRFYSKDIEMRNAFGNSIEIDGTLINIQDIRMPTFHTDFERMFVPYKGIRWTRNTDRSANGFNMMNDHLMDFYGDIMTLAGKKDDWLSYLNKMHSMQADLMRNNAIDPVRYMSMMSSLDSEVRSIARDVLGSALMKDMSRIEVRNIKNNPVYILLGGESYFKGYTFEKPVQFDIKNLKKIASVTKSFNDVRLNVDYESQGGYDRMKDLRRCITKK